MEIDDSIVGEEHIRGEKEKARRLRQSAWWMRKIGGGTCYYCRRKMGRTDLTMDHVVPLSRGGKSTQGKHCPCLQRVQQQEEIPSAH